MTKSFESESGRGNLEISSTRTGFSIALKSPSMYHENNFSADIAPKVAHEIMALAGYTEHLDLTFTPEEHFGSSMMHLRIGLEIAGNEAAKAKELEEVKAEAFELFKVSGAYGSNRDSIAFGDLEKSTQDSWIAVASKARELAKDKEK